MIHFSDGGRGSSLEIRASGFVSAADHGAAFERIALASRTAPGPLRILFWLSDLSGFEPSALWRDAWVDLGRPGGPARIAMLAEPDLHDWALTLLAPFVQAEIRVFTPRNEALARRWLASAQPRKPLPPDSVTLCRGSAWTRLAEERAGRADRAGRAHGPV